MQNPLEPDTDTHAENEEPISNPAAAGTESQVTDHGTESN